MAFDLTATAAEFLSRAGVLSWADLNWCTEDEIYGYFDEATQKLAEMGLFVSSNTQTITAAAPQYACAPNWLHSLHVSVNGQQLRPTSVAELVAYDSLWLALICEPGELPYRYSLDAGALGTITLYPQPSAAAELETIDHVSAETITPAQTLAPIPSVLSDYFLYFALQRARGKESPYQMPEIAEAAGQACALFEQVFTQYWGNAEASA
jgi:hypothetical protein